MKSLLFVFVFICATSAAHARQFPVRSDHNTEVIYLKDAEVDTAVREYFISHAHKSIDMLNFSHAADNVGIHLAKALRLAMNRGVKVRYAYESIFSSPAEAFTRGKITNLLTDSNLKQPAEVISAMPWQKIAANIALNDFIHEKLVIIDSGTPDEKIFVGGRGPADLTFVAVDSGFLLRPINPAAPYAGVDFKNFFDEFWKTLKTIYEVKATEPLNKKLKGMIDAVQPFYPRNGRAIEFAELKQLLVAPPIAGAPLRPYQFHPQAIQLVSNDFLNTFLSRYRNRNISINPVLEENPVEDTMASLIDHAKDIEISSYSLGFTPQITNGLENFIKRGGRLVFYTNSREGHLFTSPRGMAVDYTYLTYLKILADTKPSDDQVKLMLFNPLTKNKTEAGVDRPIYFHRKLMTLDETTVIGSDNFTRSSAAKNDEIIVIVSDQRMADAMREESHSEVGPLMTQVTKEFVKQDLDRTYSFSKHLMWLIEAMF